VVVFVVLLHCIDGNKDYIYNLANSYNSNNINDRRIYRQHQLRLLSSVTNRNDHAVSSYEILPIIVHALRLFLISTNVCQEGPMIHSGALCASSLSRVEFRCCKKNLKPKASYINDKNFRHTDQHYTEIQLSIRYYILIVIL